MKYFKSILARLICLFVLAFAGYSRADDVVGVVRISFRGSDPIGGVKVSFRGSDPISFRGSDRVRFYFVKKKVVAKLQPRSSSLRTRRLRAFRAFAARNSRHWTECVARRDALRSRITSQSRLLGFRFYFPIHAALLSCAMIAHTHAAL